MFASLRDSMSSLKSHNRPWIRPLITMLVAVFTVLAASSCGTQSANSHSTSGAASTASDPTTSASDIPPAGADTVADKDKDNDVGAPYDDKNNRTVLHFGHAASPSERQTIIALVKRYYQAALAGDGAKDCSLIYSPLEEAVPEDYGLSPPSQPYMRGTTCPVVLDGLFRHFHNQLAAEVPKMKINVRISEHHALALLSFGTLPERQIPVVREGHVWRMSALLDGELP